MILQLTVFVAVITGFAFMAMSFPKYKRVQLDGGYGYRTVKLPNVVLVVLIAFCLSVFQDTEAFLIRIRGNMCIHTCMTLPATIEKKAECLRAVSCFGLLLQGSEKLRILMELGFC